MEHQKFISVIKEHQNLIYKICYCYCPNPDNRKDLEQEILIQLWNSLDKFDGRIKISTWIYRIALNTAISFYRNDKKKNARNVSIDNATIISIANEEETNDNIQTLYEFIGQLKELDKALILLYLDGNKHCDIAEILGISETNIATKISRIKKELKEQVDKN